MFQRKRGERSVRDHGTTYLSILYLGQEETPETFSRVDYGDIPAFEPGTYYRARG